MWEQRILYSVFLGEITTTCAIHFLIYDKNNYSSPTAHLKWDAKTHSKQFCESFNEIGAISLSASSKCDGCCLTAWDIWRNETLKGYFNLYSCSFGKSPILNILLPTTTTTNL